jgi:ribosomal protein L11 methyltransferase
MPPKQWLELTVRGSGEAGVVSELLLAAGGGAVEERKGCFVTYLPPPSDLHALLEGLQASLRELPSGESFEIGWRWQPHQDWEDLWRRGLGLRRITSRILVAPSWEDVEPSEAEILLTIDPGLAFGTAEHATTRSCLRMLDVVVQNGDRIADVGAGSGILSIAAARLGAKEVRAFEMDPMACETAAANIERNGVHGKVMVEEVFVGGGGTLPGAPFDGLVANLQTHLILPLLSVFRASLAPEGWVILSGVFTEEDEKLIPAASRHGLSLERHEKEDGWWTGLFRNLGPLG